VAGSKKKTEVNGVDPVSARGKKGNRTHRRSQHEARMEIRRLRYAGAGRKEDTSWAHTIAREE
jgi:hypothetical protein